MKKMIYRIWKCVKCLLCWPLMMESDTVPVRPVVSPAREEPKGYLQYTDGGLLQSVPICGEATIVGSSFRADCVIRRPDVEAEHAKILCDQDTFKIVNLSSDGRTSVNRRPMSANSTEVIANGAMIGIAGLVMTFQHC